MEKTLCLASNSPRRRELIKYLGRPFITFSVDTEEKSSSKDPETFALEIAYEKADGALEARGIGDDEIIITADTCVAIDGEILGKPKDIDEGFAMLKKLSGNTHIVATGVVIMSRRGGKVEKRSLCEVTEVTFAEISDEEIKEYLATGEYSDKAGAYAIQGAFSKHIRRISGDYNNVVGFPVAAIYEALKTV